MRNANCPTPVAVDDWATYRLTPADVRVARWLCDQVSLREMSERLGVRRSTVRTQLISIYRTLGVRRRAELVAMLYPDGVPDSR
jgi:DNA-binding CsgD family transcriptional regulator